VLVLKSIVVVDVVVVFIFFNIVTGIKKHSSGISIVVDHHI